MDVSSFSGFFDGSLQKSRRAACCIEPFSLRCARCFSYFLLSLWPPSIFNDLSLRPPGSRIWWCIWNGIQSGTHEPVGGTYQQTVNGSFAAISTQASKQVRPVLLEEKKKEKRPRYPRATKVPLTWFFQYTKSSTTRSQILQKKYSLESSWRDLQELHAFAPLRPQYFRKRSRQTFSQFSAKLIL